MYDKLWWQGLTPYMVNKSITNKIVMYLLNYFMQQLWKNLITLCFNILLPNIGKELYNTKEEEVSM